MIQLTLFDVHYAFKVPVSYANHFQNTNFIRVYDIQRCFAVRIILARKMNSQDLIFHQHRPPLRHFTNMKTYSAVLIGEYRLRLPIKLHSLSSRSPLNKFRMNSYIISRTKIGAWRINEIEKNSSACFSLCNRKLKKKMKKEH